MKPLIGLCLAASLMTGCLNGPGLDVTVEGQGVVRHDGYLDGPMDCRTECSWGHDKSLFEDKGHSVCAIPDEGWRFDHAGGDCAGMLTGDGTANEHCIHLPLADRTACTFVFVQ